MKTQAQRRKMARGLQDKVVCFLKKNSGTSHLLPSHLGPATPNHTWRNAWLGQAYQGQTHLPLPLHHCPGPSSKMSPPHPPKDPATTISLLVQHRAKVWHQFWWVCAQAVPILIGWPKRLFRFLHTILWNLSVLPPTPKYILANPVHVLNINSAYLK